MTSTTIANLALARLGNSTITDITEDTEVARACQLLYEPTRRELLRSHRWNFAQKRAVLTQLATDPLFGWDHAYELPSDYMRVCEVNESEHGDVVSDRFIIEGSSLLTNSDEVNLVYVYDCSNVDLFDPIFVKAFALKLAIELCDTLRGSSSQAEKLAVEYDRLTGPLARRIDANEGRRRKGPISRSSEFVRARLFGGDTQTNEFPAAT
jgi:hypothetical protein